MVSLSRAFAYVVNLQFEETNAVFQSCMAEGLHRHLEKLVVQTFRNPRYGAGMEASSWIGQRPFSMFFRLNVTDRDMLLDDSVDDIMEAGRTAFRACRDVLQKPVVRALIESGALQVTLTGKPAPLGQRSIFAVQWHAAVFPGWHVCPECHAKIPDHPMTRRKDGNPFCLICSGSGEPRMERPTRPRKT